MGAGWRRDSPLNTLLQPEVSLSHSPQCHPGATGGLLGGAVLLHEPRLGESPHLPLAVGLPSPAPQALSGFQVLWVWSRGFAEPPSLATSRGSIL